MEVAENHFLMKNPTLSSLQLRHAAFLEVSIAVCEEGTFEGEASFAHELQCGLVDKERRLWRVELTIKLLHDRKKPFAYKGVVRVVGLIEAHPGFPEDKVANVVQVNGGAMLYAVIREMVATVTSRSAKGSLMLPTLNFRAMVANHQVERPQRIKEVSPRKSARKTTA